MLLPHLNAQKNVTIMYKSLVGSHEQTSPWKGWEMTRIAERNSTKIPLMQCRLFDYFVNLIFFLFKKAKQTVKHHPFPGRAIFLEDRQPYR